MEVKVVTNFSSISYNPSWDLQLKIDRLRRKLKKYIWKQVNGNLYYKINVEDPLYKDILELKRNNEKDIDIVSIFDVEYTDEELKKAVAFIPNFAGIQLEEYADDNMTHVQICDDCGASKLASKLVANPDGKTKMLKSNKALIKCGEQIDELFGISKLLYEQIRDKGIRDSFKPIYAKRGKEPFGFAFFAEETVHLYNENYAYEKCSTCGEINAEEKRNLEKYEEFYVEEKLDFSKGEVLYSKEFFEGNQLCIVSPKMFQWIKEQKKDAIFIPVFEKQKVSCRENV